MDDGRPQLPHSLELLWGLREEGARGPKRAFTLDDVVAAAMAVADAEGLDAVSMARVAKELGFTTMSLYRYVESKAELLQLMWHASAADAVELTGRTWRERMEQWATWQWQVLRRRSWIAQMPMSSPPVGPTSVAWVEQAMAALDGTGLEPAECLAVVGLVSNLGLGEARLANDEAAARAAGEPPVDLGEIVRTLDDGSRFPVLRRAAEAGAFDAPAMDPDAAAEASFRFGLDRVLDGVAALIDDRAAQPARRPRRR